MAALAGPTGSRLHHHFKQANTIVAGMNMVAVIRSRVRNMGSLART